jgi:hypothetical protein
MTEARPFATRRRWRLPPLYEPLPLTEHQLDGATAAAEHLLAHQLPPIFPLPVIRALWHRERGLARTLAHIRGIAA